MGIEKHQKKILAFGKQLRKIRHSKKFTQEKLANLADLEISQISRIERGIINTSISQVFRISTALDIHPKELFDFEEFSKIK